MKNKKAKNIILNICVFVFWIGVWEALSLIVKSSLLLPSPYDVAKALINLAATPVFISSVAFSLLRITAGFAAGVVFGCAAGIAASAWKAADALVSPLMTVIRSTPIASFIILMFIWMSDGGIPVFIVFLMVTPVIFAQTRLGISRADRELYEAARFFGMKGTKLLASYWIPSLFPYLKSGFLTAIGLAWKAGIAAEVLCTPSPSVGKKLYEAKTYLESAEMLAWTVTVIAMSLLLEKAVRHFVGKKPSPRGDKSTEAG